MLRVQITYAHIARVTVPAVPTFVHADCIHRMCKWTLVHPSHPLHAQLHEVLVSIITLHTCECIYFAGLRHVWSVHPQSTLLLLNAFVPTARRKCDHWAFHVPSLLLTLLAISQRCCTFNFPQASSKAKYELCILHLPLSSPLPFETAALML